MLQIGDVYDRLRLRNVTNSHKNYIFEYNQFFRCNQAKISSAVSVKFISSNRLWKDTDNF
ncbi:MAG: hypothetical protein RMX96_01990 [Nostoc sp. ChiSLP02]|nr:hypothetical protein [Nostoc sp. ChiSLP02]